MNAIFPITLRLTLHQQKIARADYNINLNLWSLKTKTAISRSQEVLAELLFFVFFQDVDNRPSSENRPDN